MILVYYLYALLSEHRRYFSNQSEHEALANIIENRDLEGASSALPRVSW